MQGVADIWYYKTTYILPGEVVSQVLSVVGHVLRNEHV